MKLPKIIVADIDGTLIDDKKKLSDYTKEVLSILHDNGIKFVIASGKPCFQTKLLNKNEWHLNFEIDGLIGMNGAELYDSKTDTIECFDMLSEEEIKEIITCMKGVPDGNCMIYKNEGLLYAYKDETSEKSGDRNGMEVSYIKDEKEFYETKNAKVLYRFHEEEYTKKALEHLEQFTFKDFYYFLTQPTMLEFSRKSVNKVNGLKKLCEKERIELTDVMAFGDMNNDNEMIKAAGIGVCLLNGSDDTKKIADYITEYDNNHDGMAHFLNDQLIIPYNLKRK